VIFADQACAESKDYRARVKIAYPAEAGGRTLLPFSRLFIVAQRA